MRPQAVTKTPGVIAGLILAISLTMLSARLSGWLETSTARTEWELRRV